MTITLGGNSYGKSAVRMMKVVRTGAHHVIREFTADIALEGEFAAAHADGDNRVVLPTDTMKNTVYAKARELELRSPDEFALALAAHFIEASPPSYLARVRIAEHGWRRLDVRGAAHDHAFTRASNELRIAQAEVSRGGQSRHVAGIEDLLILKSAQSAFSGYPRDRYTTLKETGDRILATAVSAHWTYRHHADLDFDAGFASARAALLDTFADHVSKSVQHTLYAMGEAVLAASETVEDITITMPNKHHLLVDLSAFGLDNPNEIFVPTSEPYGLISATVRREP